MYIGLQKIHKRSLSSFLDPQGLSKSGNDQIGIANGSQWDEADAVRIVIEQVSRHLQTQARFADTAYTREGHQAHLWALQEGPHLRHLLPASNQGGELRRQAVMIVAKLLLDAVDHGHTPSKKHTNN